MRPYQYFTLYGSIAAIQATHFHPIRTPATGHDRRVQAQTSETRPVMSHHLLGYYLSFVFPYLLILAPTWEECYSF